MAEVTQWIFARGVTDKCHRWITSHRHYARQKNWRTNLKGCQQLRQPGWPQVSLSIWQQKSYASWKGCNKQRLKDPLIGKFCSINVLFTKRYSAKLSWVWSCDTHRCKLHTIRVTLQLTVSLSVSQSVSQSVLALSPSATHGEILVLFKTDAVCLS
jgi:hypothetical protein